MEKIYLDNAATTQIDPEALEAMLPYLKEEYGNASSIYSLGQRGREAIDKAREQVAGFLNCQPSEIVFTGSATESDNLAIFGIVRAAQAKGIKPHIITSQIEHHAVIESCEKLEKQGVEVTYLPVGREGVVKVEDVEKAIKENTILVSIMYANNEIGAIQPIAQIGALLKKMNQGRKQKIYFHTDAVQAVNYLPCDAQELGVDLFTLSAHKIYGPKGVGVLYIKQGTVIEPIILGGGHEWGIRSGTENVVGIVGLGAAIAEIKKQQSQNVAISKLRDRLLDGIIERIPDIQINGSREFRLVNNINVSFKGAEGEALVIALDQEGIAASTGSACSSGSLDPSHVLLALGLSHQQAHGSLRLTLGKNTTEQEIDQALEVLPKVVERLRKVSGYKKI